MATTKKFVARYGVDNNGNSIDNLGATGSNLSFTGGHSVLITTTGTTSVTMPTTGTLATVGQIPTVNDGTLTLAVSGTGLSGSASFTANQAGNSTFTVTSNATSSNTASTIVARDSSGNFSAGTITASLSGNATTATALSTGRTIGMTGDVSWTSGLFDGSANVTGTSTLATVNSSPQTDAFRKITVNGKGLVTATSAVSALDITSLVDSVYVKKAGDTMTGQLAIAANNLIPLTVTNTDSTTSTNIGVYNGSLGTVIGVRSASDPAGALSYLYTGQNIPMAFSTNALERMRISADGNVGIGTTSPSNRLHVIGAANSTVIRTSDGNVTSIISASSGSSTSAVGIFGTESNHSQAFYTNNAERMRIDSSGRLLIGSTSQTDSAAGGSLEIQNTAGDQMFLTRYNTNASSPVGLYLSRSRGATVGTNTILQNGDSIGFIAFRGANGTTFTTGARIVGIIDGTPSSAANDMPTAITFQTAADDGTGNIERMRISSDGNVSIGGATTYAGNTSLMTLNYAGSTTSYGITLKPASSTNTTNAVNFLTSTSTSGSATVLGAIQHLASDAGLNLSGTWSLNGSALMSSSTVANGYVAKAGDTMTGGLTLNYNAATLTVQSANTTGGRIVLKDSATTGDNAVGSATNDLYFQSNGSERARFDSVGRLLVNLSTARSNFSGGGASTFVQVEGIAVSTSSASIISNANSASVATFILGRTRGGAIGSSGAVTGATPLGRISFQGADGTNLIEGAAISSTPDGTVSTGVVPGRIDFSTRDSSGTLVDRMRITNSGDVLVATTNTGAEGLGISTVRNLTFPEGSGVSYANIFRQSSSAATILANGYKWSTTANGFASSTGASWAKSAIGLGAASGAITFYTDSAATVANGTDVTPTERMRITSAGSIGIGTSSPQAKLDVRGSIASITSGVFAYMDSSGSAATFGTGTDHPVIIAVNGSEKMRITSAGLVGIGRIPSSGILEVQGNYSTFSDSTATHYLSITPGSSTILNTSGATQFNTAGSEKMRITSGGEVYIANTTDQGAYNLQVGGTGVWAAGAYVNGSDINLKEQVENLGTSANIVKSLRPVTFKYKREYSRDQSVQPGFIAQELQQALAGTPYVDGVVKNDTQYMSVAYQSLIPVLTKALQEALARIEVLEKLAGL